MTTPRPDRAGTKDSPGRAWISELSPGERATLVATFAGWMLDGMDVMVYSFAVPSLISLWNITKGQAGLLATSALLLSSLGGWLAGLAADRYGRVALLKITILWFAFFTFLSGFTHSFGQLLIVRGLQGLGFGGEWAVGAVLMGETIAARHRGKALGTVQSGWAIGWGIAAVCYTLASYALPPDLAWRALFWIGILPALLVFYIQRHVPEPAIFEASRISTAQAPAHFLEIFAPALLRTTLLASLVALGAQGGYHAITTWLPLYLKGSRGLSALDTSGYLLVIILGSFAGYLVSAYLADRLGRKRTLILFAGFSFLTVWLYTSARMGESAVLALGFPLGFFASGSFSPLGALFTELFPTAVRGSGQGFAYNSGRGAGALFPALVGFLSNRVPLGSAIAVFALAAYALMILGVVFLPETRGRELTA
jgi:MFS family permease